MIILRAATLAALFLVSLVQMLLAQDVTLTSRDGTVEISGDLLGFDGQFYRVQTIYGELTVDGSGVLCDGPACPNLVDYRSSNHRCCSQHQQIGTDSCCQPAY